MNRSEAIVGQELRSGSWSIRGDQEKSGTRPEHHDGGRKPVNSFQHFQNGDGGSGGLEKLDAVSGAILRSPKMMIIVILLR